MAAVSHASFTDIGREGRGIVKGPVKLHMVSATITGTSSTLQYLRLYDEEAPTAASAPLLFIPVTAITNFTQFTEPVTFTSFLSARITPTANSGDDSPTDTAHVVFGTSKPLSRIL